MRCFLVLVLAELAQLLVRALCASILIAPIAVAAFLGVRYLR